MCNQSYTPVILLVLIFIILISSIVYICKNNLKLFFRDIKNFFKENNLFFFLLTSVILFLCGIMISIFIYDHSSLKPEVLFDFAAIALGISLILIISCSTFYIGRWQPKVAWVTITLIIAISVMVFFLVELDLKEGGILIEKLSIKGVCEFSCREKFKNEINDICNNLVCNKNREFKKNISRGNFPKEWKKDFKKAYRKTEKNYKILLELSCSKTSSCLLEKLSAIKIEELQKIEIMLNDKDIKSHKIKTKIAQLIILDTLALEAFSEAINHCKCSKNSSNCSSCKNKNILRKEIDVNLDLELKTSESSIQYQY